MIVSLVSTITLKVFFDTEPRVYFTLEGEVVPLALYCQRLLQARLAVGRGEKLKRHKRE